MKTNPSPETVKASKRVEELPNQELIEPELCWSCSNQPSVYLNYIIQHSPVINPVIYLTGGYRELVLRRKAPSKYERLHLHPPKFTMRYQLR